MTKGTSDGAEDGAGCIKPVIGKTAAFRGSFRY